MPNDPRSVPVYLGLPLDHLGVAVTDLETASQTYELLGLVRDGDDEEVPDQGVRVRLLRGGESAVELLEPLTPESPLRAFLAKRGPGMHHAAFRTPDLGADIARLSAQGATLIGDQPRSGRHGTSIIFLHPSWTGGVLVELVEYPQPS